MKKHTPGPWRVGNDGHGPSIEGSNGELLAYICNGDDLCNVPIDAHANARLISAAPDLLAALERMLAMWEESIDECEDYMGMGDFARVAIRKAKGEA